LVAADLFDAPRNAIAVQRTERLERFEHHQPEAAIEDVAAIRSHLLGAYSCICWQSTGWVRAERDPKLQATKKIGRRATRFGIPPFGGAKRSARSICVSSAHASLDASLG